MRLLVIFILVIFVAAGIVIGALNANLVDYDLAFVQIHVPKGAAILAALIVGWLLGGLTAWLGISTRHHRLNRRLSRGEKKPSDNP